MEADDELVSASNNIEKRLDTLETNKESQTIKASYSRGLRIESPDNISNHYGQMMGPDYDDGNQMKFGNGSSM
jgi:hypothetical protein